MDLHKFEWRFGITAVKKDFITAEQLIEALSTQIMEELEVSNHRLIGEIFFEKKYLTAMQIKEVLNLMGISDYLLSRVQQIDDSADIIGTDGDAANDPEVVINSSPKL